MTTVLGLNIPLTNPSDTLHRRMGFQKHQHEMQPFKTTALQLHDPNNSMNLCNWVPFILFMIVKDFHPKVKYL